jgi:predicted dehydrogenase
MGNVHAGNLRNEEDVAIVAVCDRNLDRAQKMATDWDGRAYTTYQEMLAQETLDAVYVCTPTHNHGEIGLACVESGAALFVEKPVEIDLAAAMRLEEAARERGTIAAVAFHWRYSRGHDEAKRLLGQDPVALVNLRWYWTRPPIQWMWQRDLAGGQIVDQNIHLVDLSQALAGEIETVYAAYNSRQANFDEGFDNWDGYALTFRYKSGAVGNCAGTYALYPEIQDRPTADFAQRDRLVRVTDQGAELLTPDGTQSWANRGKFHAGVTSAFLQAIRRGDPSPIRAGLAEGIRSTAVVLAANHSAQTGQVVNVDEFMQGIRG